LRSRIQFAEHRLVGAGPVKKPTEAEVLARWPPVGPPVTLAVVDLGRYERPTVDPSADLAVAPAAYATPSRSHSELSCTEHRPYAGSLEVAVVEPGDVGVGASRRRTGTIKTLRVRYSRRVPGR
jgi:hypothetical protein